MLNEPARAHDGDQDEIWQRRNDSVTKYLACRPGEIEAKALHHVCVREILEDLGVFAHVCRIEIEQFIGFDKHRLDASIQTADNFTKLDTSRRSPARNSENHPVKHEEHRNLEQQRDAATDRVDLVVLVELHHLDVHLFALVFAVLVLNGFELGLK